MRSVLIAAFLLASEIVNAEPLKCTITKKFVCDVAQGCRPSAANIWNEIDLERKTFARCDRASCDTYDARMSQSGAYTNIEVPGRGLIAKLGGPNPAEFVEVATLMGTVLNSFGSCR